LDAFLWMAIDHREHYAGRKTLEIDQILPNIFQNLFTRMRGLSAGKVNLKDSTRRVVSAWDSIILHERKLVLGTIIVPSVEIDSLHSH